MRSMPSDQVGDIANRPKHAIEFVGDLGLCRAEALANPESVSIPYRPH